MDYQYQWMQIRTKHHDLSGSTIAAFIVIVRVIRDRETS
jgi:hypothetical protein